MSSGASTRGVLRPLGSRLPKLVNIDFSPGTIVHPAFQERGEGSITHRVNQLYKSSYADNTLDSYTSRVNKFVEFCRQHFLLVDLSGHLVARAITSTDASRHHTGADVFFRCLATAGRALDIREHHGVRHSYRCVVLS